MGLISSGLLTLTALVSSPSTLLLSPSFLTVFAVLGGLNEGKGNTTATSSSEFSSSVSAGVAAPVSPDPFWVAFTPVESSIFSSSTTSSSARSLAISWLLSSAVLLILFSSSLPSASNGGNAEAVGLSQAVPSSSFLPPGWATSCFAIPDVSMTASFSTGTRPNSSSVSSASVVASESTVVLFPHLTSLPPLSTSLPPAGAGAAVTKVADTAPTSAGRPTTPSSNLTTRSLSTGRGGSISTSTFIIRNDNLPTGTSSGGQSTLRVDPTNRSALPTHPPPSSSSPMPPVVPVAVVAR
mmetsp:Transcript_20757/g.46326  ORF Transcript_20757/g.46326 Transcript_20757/m.46326 type:complete len:296 (-) Transcript_20757:198-1085(-)